MALYGPIWPYMALYSLVWPCMIFSNLEWCLVALCGLIFCSFVAFIASSPLSPLLAVIDPYSFDLVLHELAFCKIEDGVKGVILVIKSN